MHILCCKKVSSFKIMYALSSSVLCVKFNLVVMTVQKSCGFIACITPVEKAAEMAHIHPTAINLFQVMNTGQRVQQISHCEAIWLVKIIRSWYLFILCTNIYMQHCHNRAHLCNALIKWYMKMENDESLGETSRNWSLFQPSNTFEFGSIEVQ